MSPLISAAIAAMSPRRAVSQSANQRAMRWKRGHHSARASGRSISGAKCLFADAAQHVHDVGGQVVGVGLREFAERFVDRRAAIGGRQRHVDGIERIEPQDVAGIDRVGIAQPVLDRGDRKPCRPRLARRPVARAARSARSLPAGRSPRRNERISRPRPSPPSSAPRPRRLPAGAGSARRPPARRRPWPNG